LLPLRDRNPSGTVPVVVYSIIAANAFVFVLELGLSQEQLMEVATRYGVVPQDVTRALRGDASLLMRAVVPAFTSMFLHGGWAHLIGNMWFLHIFGDNVEDRLGHVGFAVFYLGCGLAAGASQYALDPQSSVPCIGASGAIAGVLGAYVLCWPHARVLTIVPFFFFIHFVELPAVLVLGMWFFIQFISGAASIGVKFTHGVAYWAHIGGFVAGLAVMWLLGGRKDSRRGSRRWREPTRWR
jgi:membrane associated rhomboid family serine protease